MNQDLGNTLENTPVFNLSKKRMKCKVLKVYDGDTDLVSIVYKGDVVRINCRTLI